MGCYHSLAEDSQIMELYQNIDNSDKDKYQNNDKHELKSLAERGGKPNLSIKHPSRISVSDYFKAESPLWDKPSTKIDNGPLKVSLIDVRDPSQFKYTIKIHTQLKRVIYALTNKPDISIGDLLTSLLENYKYQIMNDRRYKTENVFLANVNMESEFDMNKQVEFTDNKAVYYIKTDTRYKNHDPNLLKRIEKDKQLENANTKNSQNLIICVKTLTGQSYKININIDSTVKELQSKIQDIGGIPVNQQLLICKCLHMREYDWIKKYNVENNDNIHVVLKMKGSSFEESSGRNGFYLPIRCSYYNLDMCCRNVRPQKPYESKDRCGRRIYVYKKRIRFDFDVHNPY